MEAAAFIAAITAAPEDDLPRLVYADWLEERGSSHAELIRVQCQLARLPADAVSDREPLQAAARRWRRRHERTWLGPLRSSVERVEWHRGFATITIRADVFTSAAFQASAAEFGWDAVVLRVRLNWVYAAQLPAIRAAPHLTTHAVVSYQKGYWDALRRNPFTQRLAWYDRAVDFQRAGDDGPMRSIDLHNAAMDAWNLRRFADARDRCREAIRLDPEQALSVNLLAWVLATCPDPSFHDGPEAVRLAGAAVGRFPECAEFMDTLAAAHARCGRFGEAVAWADRAAARQAKVRFTRRRESYARGEPFTDPIPGCHRFRARQAAGLVAE